MVGVGSKPKSIEAAVWVVGVFWGECPSERSLSSPAQDTQMLWPNIGAIVQALMALSNFGKVIVRRKYYDNCAFAGNRGFNPRGGLRKTLQPGLGPGKYVWDPNHDEWYLEFFPLQNTVVDGFDGSYEHAMLAAWRRSWEKAGKWH